MCSLNFNFLLKVETKNSFSKIHSTSSFESISSSNILFHIHFDRLKQKKNGEWNIRRLLISIYLYNSWRGDLIINNLNIFFDLFVNEKISPFRYTLAFSSGTREDWNWWFLIFRAFLWQVVGLRSIVCWFNFKRSCFMFIY